MVLTQKETSLLQDAKSQEQLCVEKYAKYANEACDSQLKGLFQGIEKQEREHLNTINDIMGGTVPSMSGGVSKPECPANATYSLASNADDKKHDQFLCADSLAIEKHASSVYNTSIFEFKDTQIRNALNHIQKEEQEHGDEIYKYMAKNGMYN